jgi:hypothetical protein
MGTFSTLFDPEVEDGCGSAEGCVIDRRGGSGGLAAVALGAATIGPLARGLPSR